MEQGLDALAYLRFVAALVFVLGLIGLGGWAMRRLGWAAAGSAGGRRGRRLQVLEVLPLDTRRRLVLIRRDQVEHLLLLGATGDVVVEKGITPPVPKPDAGRPEEAG